MSAVRPARDPRTDRANRHIDSKPKRQTEFAERAIRWQAEHGRHDLPWQRTRDPYRVWLAEVMLQQTQVATVIPYYLRFLARYPDVRALAAARSADVMALWSGLGYYARARNLHACARRVVADYGGRFPHASAALVQLPGIGRSTAAAIAAFCNHERAPILDGNVKRVLARHFGIGDDPRSASGERTFWALAQSLLPRRPVHMPAYTQALMDLGATICSRTAPKCDECPVRASCLARRQNRIEELPQRLRARVAPVRAAHWLLLRHGDSVWLEQRSPRGVWGGLLAPPSFPTDTALRSALRSIGAATSIQSLPMRRHAFTHFTLNFTPHVVEVDRAVPARSLRGKLDAADTPNKSAASCASIAFNAAPVHGKWIALKRAQVSPLPSPVRTLLIDLRERASEPAGPRAHIT